MARCPLPDLPRSTWSGLFMMDGDDVCLSLFCLSRARSFGGRDTGGVRSTQGSELLVSSGGGPAG